MTSEDQARRNEIAKDPSTPSPFPPQPDVCGHCGSSDTDRQNHALFCWRCAKLSELDGRPIEGNSHHRGNVSGSFPWANSL